MNDLQQLVQIGGIHDSLYYFEEHVHLIFGFFAIRNVDEHTYNARGIPKSDFLPGNEAGKNLAVLVLKFSFEIFNLSRFINFVVKMVSGGLVHPKIKFKDRLPDQFFALITSP